MSSRDTILNKLRAARDEVHNRAPARPKEYLSVTQIEDTSTEGLVQRFTAELERLTGKVHPVEGDAAAAQQIITLLREYGTDYILAWDFQHIPVAGLAEALSEAGIRVTFPDLFNDDRMAVKADIEKAGAGVIGADFALATTGSLAVSTAAGKGRTPTVLPPVLIAVITPDQILPHIEAWLAHQRAAGLPQILGSANICFITGPSRTGDIEMQLVLGVHGPGKVHVILKR